MSRATSYTTVAVIAFLLGGLSFWLVNRATTAHAGPQTAASDATSEAAEKSAAAEKSGATEKADQGKPRAFAIEGMSCQGCVDTITAALTKLPGVRAAQVSLQDRRATILADASQVPDAQILAAIAAAGYKGQTEAASAATPAATAQSATAQPAAAKSPVLVNITRGAKDLHAVSMAIGLAQSALKDGRPATIFLNVEAASLAAKDLGADVQFADFPPVKQMLANFLAAGGQVLICGHCAHVDHLDPQNVIAGAQLMSHGGLFETLAPGTLIFSY